MRASGIHVDPRACGNSLCDLCCVVGELPEFEKKLVGHPAVVQYHSRGKEERLTAVNVQISMQHEQDNDANISSATGNENTGLQIRHVPWTALIRCAFLLQPKGLVRKMKKLAKSG